MNVRFRPLTDVLTAIALSAISFDRERFGHEASTQSRFHGIGINAWMMFDWMPRRQDIPTLGRRACSSSFLGKAGNGRKGVARPRHSLAGIDFEDLYWLGKAFCLDRRKRVQRKRTLKFGGHGLGNQNLPRFRGRTQTGG